MVLLFGLLAGIAAAERSRRCRWQSQRFWRRGFATDAFYLLSGGIGLGLAMQQQAGAVATGVGAVADFASLRPAFQIGLAILLYDFGAYVTHRVLHRFDWLWQFHKVHHSSRVLDWLATFRAHAVEHALRHTASPVALILLGLPLSVVLTAGTLHVAWSALGHANLRLPLQRLEWLLATPQVHRMHHRPEYSEKNFGTMLTLWDRLAGSFVLPETSANSTLGVPGEVETYPQTWGAQLLQPLRRAAPVVAAEPTDYLPGSQTQSRISGMSSPYSLM